MLRVQANLPFDQLGHQCLLLLSAGIVIQNYSSCWNRYFLEFYDTGRLLTEDYIRQLGRLLKYYHIMIRCQAPPGSRNNALSLLFKVTNVVWLSRAFAGGTALPCRRFRCRVVSGEGSPQGLKPALSRRP